MNPVSANNVIAREDYTHDSNTDQTRSAYVSHSAFNKGSQQNIILHDSTPTPDDTF